MAPADLSNKRDDVQMATLLAGRDHLDRSLAASAGAERVEAARRARDRFLDCRMASLAVWRRLTPWMNPDVDVGTSLELQGRYVASAIGELQAAFILGDTGAFRHTAQSAAADVRKVPARHDRLYCMFSASKMVTAMLVHLLDERHQIHLDDPVAHHIPEFGKKGKHHITLRHVLTHRAGIPRIPPEFADPNLLGRPAEILGLLCEQAPVWRPGRRLGYHALTGGYVLGAVIERVTGKDVQTFQQDEISRFWVFCLHFPK